MGVDTRPFIGMGFMLRSSDMDNAEFNAIYQDLVEKYGENELWNQELYYCKNIDMATDAYNGSWVFIGEWQHGDEEDILRMPRSFLSGNGDDIDLELKRQLGEDHPFLQNATFGVYFGTDWT